MNKSNDKRKKRRKRRKRRSGLFYILVSLIITAAALVFSVSVFFKINV